MSKGSIKIAMTPPHPGAFVLDEVLEPLALSITEAAKVLHVRRANLSNLVNGKIALSAEMALRLEIAFGLDMEQLLRTQAWHDAVAARSKRNTREMLVKPYRKSQSA
jgi:addiction module HigA family antidote